ncbi:DNA-3-methyladenine glycosylase I [Salinivibrio proteolyticus]|uniref:DNA-3-methyladenine glycosylase I n=1 Tax=Salinivibrio proteolyticus TaxID=334715 RepID=A0ABY7LIN2_9GAMM|nr:DNA-3-methyladenine glycosylase I [Salinivibrio proteolyticus]WBA15330.1 DNA-3-methyladenine glycosylase I [Salinivibrio proteolyticus]
MREKFSTIYQRAAERKGGQRALEHMLVAPLVYDALCEIPDDRWLAAFSQKVFQSGISWQVVRKKWPGFEEVFWGFDIEKMLLMPPEMWEEKATNPAIIRHLTKVMTIPHNAEMIHRVQQSHGSFSQFVADWPSEDIVGLWQYLKKHGKRLGGNTGAYTLRRMGKDTFLFTRDIEHYLRATKIVDSGRETKRAMQAAQQAFNEWQQESGRSLNHISQLIAFSVGDNRV